MNEDNIIEPIEEDKKSIWNKTSEEVTVADGVKLQLGVLAVFAGVGAVATAGPAAVEGINRWRLQRKLNKALKNEAEMYEEFKDELEAEKN